MTSSLTILSRPSWAKVVPFDVLKDLGGQDKLNMTRLAMNLSNYINGVAKKHGEVSEILFPGYKIQAITNGVHTFTWTCESIARLFDKYLPGWANEPGVICPDREVPGRRDMGGLWRPEKTDRPRQQDDWRWHGLRHPDHWLCKEGHGLQEGKSPVLRHGKTQKKIGKGKLQIIYAGKAHPKDADGKRNIEEIVARAKELKTAIKIVYLENYNMDACHEDGLRG